MKARVKKSKKKTKKKGASRTKPKTRLRTESARTTMSESEENVEFMSGMLFGKDSHRKIWDRYEQENGKATPHAQWLQSLLKRLNKNNRLKQDPVKWVEVVSSVYPTFGIVKLTSESGQQRRFRLTVEEY